MEERVLNYLLGSGEVSSKKAFLREYMRAVAQGKSSDEAYALAMNAAGRAVPKSSSRVEADIVFNYGHGSYTLQGSMAKGYFDIMRKAIGIVFKKNADYSTDDDPFRNFRESEGFGVPSYYAVMVRLSDKWSRLKNYFLNGGYKVEDEGVIDTIVDSINYLAILGAMLADGVDKDEKGKKV